MEFKKKMQIRGISFSVYQLWYYFGFTCIKIMFEGFVAPVRIQNKLLDLCSDTPIVSVQLSGLFWEHKVLDASWCSTLSDAQYQSWSSFLDPHRNTDEDKNSFWTLTFLLWGSRKISRTARVITHEGPEKILGEGPEFLSQIWDMRYEKKNNSINGHFSHY